jgi:hypothetical protein
MNRSMQRFSLAVLAVLVASGIVAALYVFAVPAESEKVLFMALGNVLSWPAMAFAYYFGTSEGSAQKTDILTELTKGKDQ